MLKSINNLTGIFHLVIIASLALGFSGCGHKASPFYTQESQFEDENIKFIQKSEKNSED